MRCDAHTLDGRHALAFRTSAPRTSECDCYLQNVYIYTIGILMFIGRNSGERCHRRFRTVLPVCRICTRRRRQRHALRANARVRIQKRESGAGFCR